MQPLALFELAAPSECIRQQTVSIKGISMHIVRQQQLGKEYMFNKIALLLIIGCMSSSSYAGMLGDCNKTMFEFSDLKELKKNELISEYCLCKGLESIGMEYAKKFQAIGEYDRSSRSLEDVEKCVSNSDRIQRILENKHKYKKVISCS